MNKDCEVYRDGRYLLGFKNGYGFIGIDGKEYKLSCHPYEPCLYITDEDGRLTAVHNSFDPEHVITAFSKGALVTSITGFEYDAKDFCIMAEYAAGAGDIGIDDAEKVFGGRDKKKSSRREGSAAKPSEVKAATCPEYGKVIEDDPFYGVIAEYPDSAVDYCLAQAWRGGSDPDAHRCALASACRKLFTEENGDCIWSFDVGRANGVPAAAEALFAPVRENGELNYRRAFLNPPYENGYSNADFDRVNAALFPKGTDGLIVYKWTTDWSEYFDDGHEWWGTLCLTVYDKKLDRFAVIMASATD